MAPKPSIDPATVKAALALLSAGKATLAETAELIGTSRQLVRHWCQRSGLDAPAARAAYLAREWSKLAPPLRGQGARQGTGRRT